MMIDREKLISLAEEAMAKAYCPYSGFAVGAALLCKSGKIYQGCNIENASFSPTVCAERSAFFKAVYDGEREFSAIAVVGGKAGEKDREIISPCGVCRQVMAEFCEGDFEIIMSDGKKIKTMTLDEILPLRFSSSDME